MRSHQYQKKGFTCQGLPECSLLFIFMTTVAIANIVAENIPRTCPADYDYYSKGNKCYKFYANDIKTWSEARETCQRENADLFVIQDEETGTFIKNLVKKHSMLDESIWLGLRETTQGSYVWIDNNPLSYVEWGYGEPNNVDTTSLQCIVNLIARATETPNWNDVPCSTRCPYICEKPLDIYPTCSGDEWILNTQNGKCYKIQRKRRTFDDSRARCQREGSDLVTIPDDESWLYVLSLIKPTIGTARRYWIGLTSPTRDRQYEWLDGASLDVSKIMVFTYYPTEHWATLQCMNGNYGYTDRESHWKYPSICRKDASKDFPVFECPHGYATYVMTSSNGWRITCLMGEDNDKESYSDAREKCQNTGGDLLQVEADYQDMQLFIQEDLHVFDTYWYNNADCQAYTVSSGASQKQCADTYSYICQHWGMVRTFMDLSELTSIDKTIYVSNYGTLAKSCLGDVCQTSNLTELHSLHDWTRTSTHVSIITGMNLTRLTMGDQNTVPLLPYDNECRVEATLRNAEDVGLQSRLRVTFSMDNLLCLCKGRDVQYLNDAELCPGKVSRESIGLYKHVTTPKTGSIARYKLCPCRCDSQNTDYNPSPKVLAEIISNIQNELSVDTEQLSLKRNKKRSAADNRTESQAIGYVGIVLCLIPFCVLVVADISRIFIFFIRG